MTSSKFSLMGPGSRSDIIPYTLGEMKQFYTMNTGNMIFYYACECIINFDNTKYGWGGNPNIINNNAHGILIPMANQIGSHFDLKTSGPKISEIKVPVVVLGLGVQFKIDGIDIDNIPEGTIEWLQKRWFPELNYEQIRNWFIGNSDVYFSVPQWIYNYARRDFVIGTRIHGIQAAIQAGTPAVCLYIDIRTKELC